ncbi:MAG: glycosyltransferase family 2 protein [Firmicutes bacterium]|nr:glycosyltransferase family 2 protein [Bacillota bacterium]
MITISLCMIVRDEEDVLDRCLTSVRGIADEIIVVDTGSKDGTKAIAIAHGARVYDFEWIDDFAAARNAAFDKAAMEYILWLDADDIVDEENRRAFIALKETLDPAVDMVMMRYHVAFDEEGNPTYTFFRERLMRRAKQYRWDGRVHEAIAPSGNMIRSQIAVQHKKVKHGDPNRNLRIYERIIAEGETMQPRHRYYYARELFALGRDDESITLLRQCVDDPNTWVENRIGACQDLAGCLTRKGDLDGALLALLQSFAFGEPRAEICCDIGKIFLDRGRYREAIFWYDCAPRCAPSEEGGGFAQPECRGYIPYMQLCLCYGNLKEYELSEMYNEKAAALKEGDASVQFNREYFRARRARQAAARR